jgi:hypothetical protein
VVNLNREGTRETEKRERKKESGEVLRDTTFRGEQEIIYPVLKVPRQCPFVLL